MINKVILIGNVGGEITERTTDKLTIIQFKLATFERGYVMANGREVPERTDWHTITVFGKLADVAKKIVTKGSRVYIEGSIRYNIKEEADGTKKYYTEIHAKELQMIKPKVQEQTEF